MFRNLSTELLQVSGRESELIELALSNGFQGISIDLAEFLEQVKVHGLARARRLIESARLQVGAFRLTGNWDGSDEEFKQDFGNLEVLAGQAAELGAKLAVTTIAPANDIRPYHENFEFHVRRLNQLGEMLEKSGIKLGVAFVATAAERQDRAFQFLHSMDAVLMLLSMLRAKNVGLVADLWQIHASGGSLADLEKLPPERMLALIVSDAPADVVATELTADQRMFPGETGAINLGAALVFAAERGFAGPVIPAVSAIRTRGMRREEIVKTAGTNLVQAWKAAGLSPAGKLSPAVKK